MKRLPLFCLLLYHCYALAQQDQELNPGLTIQAQWSSGLTTAFRAGSESYSAMLSITPQYTIAEGRLRGGLVTGFSYASQRISTIAGPLLSIKLLSLGTGPLGTVANLQLTLEYLWRDKRQGLAGGSLQVEAGKRFVMGPRVYVGTASEEWWIHWGLGWMLGRPKYKPEPFNQ